MKLEIHHKEKESWSLIQLDGGRMELGNFLSCLSAEKIDALKLYDYAELRLPLVLASFDAVTSVEFVRCHQFGAIPPGLHRLESLQLLRFEQCADFHSLEGIDELESLRALRINACESFDELDGAIRGCGRLEMLDLSENGNLQTLDVASLPKNLRLLDVRGCENLDIPDIPDSCWPHLVSTNAAEWPLDQSARMLGDISIRLQKLLIHRNGGAADPGGE